MENPTQVLDATRKPSAGRQGRARLTVSLFVLVALLGTALVIAHDAGTPSPEHRSKIVSAVKTSDVADSGAPASLRAQINVSGIACAVLDALVGAFVTTPFFAFVANILISLRVSFGCVSPG